MRSSKILLLYIARHYLRSFATAIGLLLSIVFVFETVELLRRTAGKEAATLVIVLEMALAKLPEVGQEMLPFAVLFSAMYTFWRLTRSSELVVARAIGLSAWQFLLPVLLCAFLIGAAKPTLISPLSAALLSNFEQLERDYIRRNAQTIKVSEGGLWLRQDQGSGSLIFHARSIDRSTLRFDGTMLLFFDAGGSINGRMDGGYAILRPGYWEVMDAWYNRRNLPPQKVSTFRIDTELDLGDIEESFASPKTMSFWQLPQFINTLQGIGFAVDRLQLHYQALLAEPFLLCGMVLLAAAFSLRPSRRGNTLFLVTGGLGTAFAMFLVTDIVQALGASGSVPVALAAWTPAGVSLMLGIATILHLEDG